jgi:adenylylsulfate kinase
MLIAMAGLPGTGKSTLAVRLAAELGGVVMSKDSVRAALFPVPVLDYSEAENDIAMAAIFHAAAHVRQHFPQQSVVIDGRTFLRAKQLDDLFHLAKSLDETPSIIECICSDNVVRQRLENALTLGEHPAKNRTFDLFLSVKAKAEPIAVPHLVLDTGAITVDECVRRCLAYLREGQR